MEENKTNKDQIIGNHKDSEKDHNIPKDKDRSIHMGKDLIIHKENDRMALNQKGTLNIKNNSILHINHLRRDIIINISSYLHILNKEERFHLNKNQCRKFQSRNNNSRDK